MSKNILIDSAHSEETRVAVVDGGKLEKYDFESTSKIQVKGNIYLAKVIRVEPSLQAAFVDYGNDRHGFLSFSEIHQDYFQIPVDDRQELDAHITNAIAARAEELGVSVEELEQKEVGRIRYQLYRRYKIQEVIKKRQIMLVQVTKEERGNKGASLTTYISLAGRYCVLMPNTEKSSGVSRKITNHTDRIKLKKVVSGLKVEHGSVVLRTAAVGHTKAEIGKDFDYLCKMWDEIRKTTLKSTAPCLIHEEAGIIKRAVRDMYSRDVDAIYVEGKEGYKTAKNFMKGLMPSHAKKIQLYEDTSMPLFKKFSINDQIRQIYSTRVDLPSGGYLIINNTEALIAVDVNSGRATRERNIAGTALKTNLEAAAALARQCKLRDLAGLIVVDFIDMDDKRDNIKVEKCLKNALRDDKAKIQVGSITNFGLLEFSRQRLRSSIADANMIVCPHCRGTGFMWTEESNSIQVLRRIEEICSAMDIAEVRVTLPPSAALYIINNKRTFLSHIEERNHMKVTISIDPSITALDFKIDTVAKRAPREEREDEIGETAGAEQKNAKKVKKAKTEKSKITEIPISDEKQKNEQSPEEKSKNEQNPEEKLKKIRRKKKDKKDKHQDNNETAEAVAQTEMQANDAADKTDGMQTSAVIKVQARKRSRKRREGELGTSAISAERADESTALTVNPEKSAELTPAKEKSKELTAVEDKSMETAAEADAPQIIEKKKKTRRHRKSKSADKEQQKQGEFAAEADVSAKNGSIEGQVFSNSFIPDNLDMVHLDYISRLGEINGSIAGGSTVSPPPKSASQGKKRRGWWQKLLKNPDAENQAK